MTESKDRQTPVQLRTLWGNIRAARARYEDDPQYLSFVAQQDRLQQEGKLAEYENPTGAPSEQIAERGVFTFRRCTESGFIYANPRMTPAAMRDHFAENDFSDYFETVEASHETRKARMYDPMLSYLRDRVAPPASLLEIGCGSGALLGVLRDEGGYDVAGVEIAEAAQPYFEKRDLLVYRDLVEELSVDRRFDVVLMWSVLDHLCDPVRALRACNEVLTDGGHIVIGNINTDGFDHRVLGLDSATFRPPTRVNYYNIASLRAHLELSGFEIVEVDTPGFMDVAMVRDYWSEGHGNGRNAFLEDLILNEENAAAADAFQDFLRKWKLSGYQRVFARKVATPGNAGT